MNYKLQFKHYDGTDHVRQLVETSVARLDRLAARFPQDALSLRVLVEKNDVRTLYRVSLTLAVPGRTLAAEEERHDETEALREAFAELERQLGRYRKKVTHSHEYDRPARRQAIRRAKVEAVAPEELRTLLFSSIIEQHLGALYNFVRRELAYHVAMRDLRQGEVAVDDEVAAVTLRAAREFTTLKSIRNVRGWLLHLAVREIDREVERAKRERGAARLEADMPGTPPVESVSTLGDEALDLQQFDENLKLADVLASKDVPTPEQILESKELQLYVARTLATLPRAWRRAFVLNAVDGLKLGEVSRIVSRSKAAVAADLKHAREYLRERLMEAGWVPQEESAQRVFGTRAQHEVPARIQEVARSAGAAAME